MTKWSDEREFEIRLELPDDGRADDACRPSESGPEGWAFAILLLLPMPVVIVLLIGTGTPPIYALGLLALMFGFSLGSLWMVVRLLWEPFRRRYPAVHPTERARWKRLQAIRLGFIGGFNYCVDVGSDVDHVHLRLMAPFGLMSRPMSIPRSVIDLGDRRTPKRMLGMTRVRLAGRASWLPSWAVETPPQMPADQMPAGPVSDRGASR